MIQIPFFQKKVIDYAAKKITQKLHFPVTVGGFNLNWVDEVALTEVVMKDPKGIDMIFVGKLILDFKINNIWQLDFAIEDITLQDGGVNLVSYENGNININDFINSFSANDSSIVVNDSIRVPFEVPYIRLENMKFSFEDVLHEHISDFDHRHFGFDSIYADVYNLLIVGDTFRISVIDLKTVETHTNLRIHKLSTEYTISANDMNFANLHAEIGESVVKDYMNFSFSEITNLAYFVDSATVTLNLDQSIISLQDLSLFNAELKPYVDKITISGLFKGKVNNFGVRNLDFAFGKNSVFRGKLEVKGLPDVKETFVGFNFKNSLLSSKDIRQYSDDITYRQFQKFSTIAGNGKFIGFANDFVASGDFQTGLGNLKADINFKIDDDKYAKAFYEGKIKTKNFELGKLIELEDEVGKIDIDGFIEGEGVDMEKALVKVKADIQRIELRGYNYKNIYTNAVFRNNLFDGELTINDSNLVMSTTGKVDFRNENELVRISGEIKKANLKPLNLSFSNKEVLLKTNFYFDFNGFEIDNIVGNAGVANTYLLYKGEKEVYIDSLKIATTQDEGLRKLRVNSNLFTLDASGHFDYTTLIADVQKLYKEYQISFSNDNYEEQLYYASKSKAKTKYYELDFAFHAKNINQILSMYVPNLYLSSGFFVKGNFTNGKQHFLNLQSHIDTLYLNENEIIKTEIELSTSKTENSPDVMASMYFNTKNIKLKSGFTTNNIYFEGNWKQDNIDFVSKAYKDDTEDHLFLNGLLQLGERTQKLAFVNSEVKILDKIWKIDSLNKVFLTPTTISLENFKIFNQSQFIALNGDLSSSEDHEAQLTINNFDVDNINALIKDYKLDGTLNADFTIKSAFKDIITIGTLTLDTFKVDKFLIGNISGNTEYDIASNTIKLGIEVQRDDIKVINILGNIIPGSDSTDGKLRLEAELNNTDLEILNPLLSGVLTDINGKASGKFKITGSTNKIVIAGKADVKQGKFKIPYLGTTYYFDDQITISENMIGFKKLRLKDVNGNIGTVDGGLYHDNFNHFLVDLRGNFDNLKLLELEEKDNKQFYGDANVSGNFEILGSFDDLKINAFVKSNKGTKIYIPINSSSSLEKQSYIKFVNAKEQNLNLSKRDSVDISGLKMELNLEITPDAYTEIIFDKRTGDIIRGYGNGNLKLKIDTRGDFSMAGNFRFIDGWYNFTLAGLINKEFRIKNGSSINWSGSPYDGVMNIDAEYAQFVSMKPLLRDTLLKKNPEVARKYPTVVKLGLTGNLLSPEIKMGIDILRNPSFMNDEVIAFKAKLEANEQELNRQVFSVLILGGLAPENSFSGISNPTNNLSEMLSNQLSNWLSQVDDKLEIDVNLNSLDKNALNTFQMRLSYTALNGRLRITRDGSFRSAQNNNQSSVSNIAGEWTVEYLLSDDGKFRLKLFNKTNQNMLINSAGGSANGTAGFSVLHTQNFNNLKDLIKPDKEKKNLENSLIINTESAAIQNPEPVSTGDSKTYIEPANKDVKEEDEEVNATETDANNIPVIK